MILATFMEAAVDPPPPFPMSTLRLESPFAPSLSWMCSVFSFPSDWAHPVLCAPNALLLGLLRQFKKDPASELWARTSESAIHVIPSPLSPETYASYPRSVWELPHAWMMQNQSHNPLKGHFELHLLINWKFGQNFCLMSVPFTFSSGRLTELPSRMWLSASQTIHSVHLGHFVFVSWQDLVRVFLIFQPKVTFLSL